MENLVWKRGR